MSTVSQNLILITSKYKNSKRSYLKWKDVISALNRNPKISLPLGVSYSVISFFIREACRLAWEMSTLAYPLDTAFALDGEVFDDSKYV